MKKAEADVEQWFENFVREHDREPNDEELRANSESVEKMKQLNLDVNFAWLEVSA